MSREAVYWLRLAAFLLACALLGRGLVALMRGW